MKLFGIFFSDGDRHSGWLHFWNGKLERLTFAQKDMHAAQELARLERAADHKTVFRVLRLDASYREMRAVRLEAIDREIERAKRQRRAANARIAMFEALRRSA